MPHFRKSSKDSKGGSSSRHKSSRDSKLPSPPKHHRTHTAPDPPTLLRLPSISSTVSAATTSRSRRATNPSAQSLSSATTATTATSSSYVPPSAPPPITTSAPPPPAGPNDARSPGSRRPPASFSGHGIDTSRGPPITLITRGNSDIARRSSQQKPTDYAFAQQQFLQSGLVSPGGSHTSSRGHRRGGGDERELKEGTGRSTSISTSTNTPQTQQTNTSTTTTATSTRRNSTTSTTRPTPHRHHSKKKHHMASSVDDSSEYDSGPPSHSEDTRPPPPQRPSAQRVQDSSTSSGSGSGEGEGNGEQAEDLFLHIAADSAPKQRLADAASRHDRLRSRIARVNRQSSPLPLLSPSPGPSSSVTPTTANSTNRVASTGETRTVIQNRRVSHQPTSSRSLYPDRVPMSPSTPIERPPSRVPELSSKQSFSRPDSSLSPQEFLAQIQNRRRPSQPDALQTPPARSSTYRPSNLGHYSTPRDDPRTVQPESAQIETLSRPDGTESHGSTGPAVSVWDELDELKTRIRRIEMGGKIPSTSSAIISQATAERPRTANTSATTVSSSPNQQRKSNPSPSESTVGAPTPTRPHPLLREALAKAKIHITPAVYRTLEATASEALTLAELTGSGGPQGTLHSASSILGSANGSDRQIRRKADNICRSLTELCIALCDTNPSVSSPAVRASPAPIPRRPSVQLDSPTIRQSIEPESNTLSGISPSRALNRIEARRTSMLNGTRDGSQEPFEYDRQIPSRLSRAGTSLHRTRQSVDDEDEDGTMRAPSRAMTDFRSMRSTNERSRLTGRQYTSREPMPDLQPAPTLHSTASLRRPTVSGTNNENSLLFRDGNRRYDLLRESSPAYEKQAAGTLRARAHLAANRNPNNRNSIGGISDLGRSVSLGRRMRGNSTGE